MSAIPEIIFQTVIVRGIKTLREDSRFIDQLFKNLSTNSQQQIRDFIKNNAINLVLNYPREQLKVPSIVLLLKTEEESYPYLSDSMGVETPDEFGYEGGVEPEILGGTAAVSSVSGPGRVIFGPHKVLSATSTSITVSDNSFIADCFVTGTVTRTIHIVAGTGKGQIRTIVSNTGNTVNVDPAFTITPDSTSIFEIREEASEIIGEPEKLYDRRDEDLTLERRGGVYTTRYQAQLVGANPEQAIFLYAILKSIFTISRLFLESQGVINMRMSGTDLVHRSEFIPDYAYMRVMNVEFENPFDIYEELTGLADNFRLVLRDATEKAVLSDTNLSIAPSSPIVEGP